MEKPLFLLLSAAILLGAGCKQSQIAEPKTDVVPVSQAPAAPIALTPSLAGAWHGNDVVGAGFSERYSFFDSGKFLFIQGEDGYPEGQQPKAAALLGEWILEGQTLTLISKRGLYFDELRQPLIRPSVSKQEITLGSLETLGESGPYSIKTLLGDRPFWKWSDDPLYACPPNLPGYHAELAYYACDLLLNAYMGSK